MKRQLTIVVFAIFFLLSSLNWAGAEGLQQKEKGAFILPPSLIEIEEEGFWGTNAQTVVFPDGFMTLQDGVFENALKIQSVYLPPSTAFIAESAFPKKADLTIYGAEESYTQEWAEAHEFQFVPREIGNLTADYSKKIREHKTDNYFFYLLGLLEGIDLRMPLSETENLSRRPQDRPELNPVDYKFP